MRRITTSPAENIKPESWISRFDSLGKIDNKFKDRASQLNWLAQNLKSKKISNDQANLHITI